MKKRPFFRYCGWKARPSSPCSLLGPLPQRDLAGEVEERLGRRSVLPRRIRIGPRFSTTNRRPTGSPGHRHQPERLGGVAGDELELELGGQLGGRGGRRRGRRDLLLHLGDRAVPGHVRAGGVVLEPEDPLAVAGGVEVRAGERADAEVRVGAVGVAQRFDLLAVRADPEEGPGGDVHAALLVEGDAVGVLAAADVGEGLSGLLLAAGEAGAG